jgi:hypothetical protein
LTSVNSGARYRYVHPLAAGLFGGYTRIANDLIAASDALIVVG